MARSQNSSASSSNCRRAERLEALAKATTAPNFDAAKAKALAEVALEKCRRTFRAPLTCQAADAGFEVRDAQGQLVCVTACNGVAALLVATMAIHHARPVA